MGMLVGYISTTYHILVETFGFPNVGPNESGKSTCEWWIKNSNDDIISIYDWKNERTPIFEKYDWHIGGTSQEDLDYINARLSPTNDRMIER